MVNEIIGMEGLWDFLEMWVGGYGHGSEDIYSRQGIARCACEEYGERRNVAELSESLHGILGKNLPRDLEDELMELEMAREILREHPALIELALGTLDGRAVLEATRSFIREANGYSLDAAWDACLDVDAGMLVYGLMTDVWVLCAARSVGYEETELRIKASRYVEAYELFVQHYTLFDDLASAPSRSFRY